MKTRVLLCGCLVATTGLLMNESTGVAQSGYEVINLVTTVVNHHSSAADVNNGRQVVGYVSQGPPPFGPTGVFSWTPTGGLVFPLADRVGRDGDVGTVAVNDSGQVVFNIANVDGGPHHAFLWTLGAQLVDLGTLGGTVEATAINASGQITGWSDIDAVRGTTHAFLWTAAGGMHDLGTLGGEESEARAVNDTGRVVGWSEGRTETGGFRHAFLWTPTDGMMDLGTLGGRDSEAVAVNGTDRVVGWSEIAMGDDAVHAFSWTAAGGMVDLGTLGGVSSKANAVSASGQIVGWSEIAIGNDAVHAFSWTPAGGLLDLGTLGHRDSEARAVNAAGRVVGNVWTPQGSVENWTRRAFSWTAAEGMVDLGTLGGSRSYASALNERGDVIGSSTLSQIAALPFYATMWRRLVPDVTPDATPPTLLLPTTIVVDATGPAGGTVTYTVSATDDGDPNPVVRCSPASGSVFPLLLTTVGCTATDAAGNSAHGVFDVIVRNTIQWTVCAVERDVCAFTGPATVRYGANGAYVYKTLTDGTACTNEVFGDPVYGTVKQCAISPPAETGWTFCASEGGVCAFTGPTAVRYGANGAYVYKTLTDGAFCTNAVFGDPIYGTVKQCAIGTPDTTQ